MVMTQHGLMEFVLRVSATRSVYRSGAQCFYVADTPRMLDRFFLSAKSWKGPYPSSDVARFHADQVCLAPSRESEALAQYVRGRVPLCAQGHGF